MYRVMFGFSRTRNDGSEEHVARLSSELQRKVETHQLNGGTAVRTSVVSFKRREAIDAKCKRE